MYFLTLSIIFTVFSSTVLALPSIIPLELSPRSGKPTGGPASAKITVYTSYACTNLQTSPPIDGSAGSNSTVTIAETQCAILPIPLGAAITAVLTANPKSGTAGCYVQIFQQQGCGVVLGNNYVGYPFDGVVIGNKVGCVAPIGGGFGAVEIVCG